MRQVGMGILFFSTLGAVHVYPFQLPGCPSSRQVALLDGCLYFRFLALSLV